ncbi:MAG: glycosyltransferase family 4 protein [Candidatus Thermoplasmatota archaeon]|nr:glycosyltransferase family 4 protein [Candidatus Thermoplasmatota archaeon]
MRIKIVYQEGFSNKYTGGGSYLTGIYQYIPFEASLKINTQLRPIPGSMMLSSLLNYYRIKNSLNKRPQQNSIYDIIHNNNVLFFPKLKNSTVVTTVHHLHFHMYDRIISPVHGLYFPLEALMLHHSDYVITVSQFTKEKLNQYFSFPDEKIVVIPNGINTEIYTPKKLPEKNIIVFPNALRYPRRKGTYFILPVLNEILKKYNHLRIILTGQIDTEGESIRSSLSSRFEYVGFVEEHELSRLFNQALLVIFPSLYEGYGLVPLEVIASGGVVVSADVGAVSSYLKNNLNGFLLRHNAKKWQEIINTLIENPLMRAKIRENNNKKKVRSWKDCADDHIRFFNKIIK